MRNNITVPTAQQSFRANILLSQIAEVQKVIRTIQQERDTEIEAIHTSSAEQLLPFLLQQKQLEADLLAHVTANRHALLKHKKTLLLQQGVIGFRVSHILDANNWDQVLRVLIEDHPECVRVKRSVDKTALRQLPDERLQGYGVTRITQEHFFYEIPEDSIETGSPRQEGEE